jgi:hypothetical protein
MFVEEQSREKMLSLSRRVWERGNEEKYFAFEMRSPLQLNQLIMEAPVRTQLAPLLARKTVVRRGRGGLNNYLKN